LEDEKIRWFLLTSANLSKSAWGMIQPDSTFLIRNYELGVFFSPSNCGLSDYLDSKVCPLPYHLPLIKYSKEDQPWIWDVEQKDQDVTGQIYDPNERYGNKRK
jgi:tyrosyl-DNA phosphodiesterase-1